MQAIITVTPDALVNHVRSLANQLSCIAERSGITAALRFTARHDTLLRAWAGDPVVHEALFGVLETGRAQRNAAAIACLASLHAEGAGVPMDHRQAAALYEEAAWAGNAQAAVDLALLRLDGKLGEADLGAAFDWLCRAALAEEHPEALWRLGDFYQAGWHVGADPVMAFELYCKAYSRTRGTAHVAFPALRLAHLYLDGIAQELPAEPLRALMLYQEAEASCYAKDAGEDLKTVLDSALTGQALARTRLKAA